MISPLLAFVISAPVVSNEVCIRREQSAKLPRASFNDHEHTIAFELRPCAIFRRLPIIPSLPSGSCATAGLKWINSTDLFKALMNWVEKSQPPGDPLYRIIAWNGPNDTGTYSRPICKYPDTLTYVSGPITIASSFTCTPNNRSVGECHPRDFLQKRPLSGFAATLTWRHVWVCVRYRGQPGHCRPARSSRSCHRPWSA